MSEVENVQDDVQDLDTGDNTPSVEDIARERGWRPQDEYDGDPNRWVDASEYVYRGELMDTISQERKRANTLTKELDEIKGTVSHLHSHYEKMAKKEVQEKLKTLKNQRRQALDADDHEAADELEDQIDEIKEASRKIESQENNTDQTENLPEVPAEIKAWVATNAWVEDTHPEHDPEATGVAATLLKAEVERRGEGKLKESLDAVDKKLRKLYPEKYETRRRSTTSVDTPNAPTGKGKGRLASKMTDVQRKFAERCVRAGSHESVEAYAKDLHDLGELG